MSPRVVWLLIVAVIVCGPFFVLNIVTSILFITSRGLVNLLARLVLGPPPP